MENFKEKTKLAIKKNYAGYIAILPLILGILIFTIYPVVVTLGYSFHDYNAFDLMRGDKDAFSFIQYQTIFGVQFPTVLKSLGITFSYTAIMIPFNMIVGFLLALWVNKNNKLMGVFRLLLYIPCLIPAVVSGIIWRYVGDVNFGIGNAILQSLGLPKFQFLESAKTSFTALVAYSMFGVSSSILIWLSSLKSVPVSYYEAAEVEGCGPFRRLVYITIPMCTPFILYTLLTNLIATIQTFANVYTITGNNAGMEDSLLFYVIYIYREAFSSFNISYASALSWVLFVIIAAISAVLLKTSKWVYYGEEM